jgi:hypothetical protein
LAFCESPSAIITSDMTASAFISATFAEARFAADGEDLVAAQVIETIMRTQNASDVSELRGWARKVGRFLLHGPH